MDKVSDSVTRNALAKQSRNQLRQVLGRLADLDRIFQLRRIKNYTSN